jgi:uncharacterized protein (DUF58 family)
VVIAQRRWILEFCIAAGVVGVWAEVPLVAGAAAFLLALALAAEWMARRAHATMKLAYRTSRSGLAIGDTADVWLTVENPEPWPLPTVHFEGSVPAGLDLAPPLPPRIQRAPWETVMWGTFSVGAHERVRHRLTVTGRTRGRWLLGQPRVWSGDPLGWASFERRVDQRAVLTVYPQLYAVPPGIMAPQQPQGERRGPPWNPQDPLRIAGVRPYQPGDARRLIHPYATARTGTLQVKRLDPEGAEQVELLALAATAPFMWEGVDADRFEALVSAAASVANGYLKGGTAVGLSVVGTVYGWPRGVNLAPARGPEQWSRIMTALAWVQPGGGQGHDLTPALAALARRLRPGTHLLVLACFYRNEWTGPLQRLVQRGVQVTLVPVGAAVDVPRMTGVRVRPWTPGVVHQ